MADPVQEYLFPWCQRGLMLLLSYTVLLGKSPNGKALQRIGFLGLSGEAALRILTSRLRDKCARRTARNYALMLRTNCVPAPCPALPA